MKYFSTRDQKKESFPSAYVIKKGLASDGGLFVPDSIPALSKEEIIKLSNMNYADRTAYVLSLFLTDYSLEELTADTHKAYCKESFPDGAAPLADVSDSLYSLELWHGPTAAFKDMALQIMPRLLSKALEKTGEKRTALILVATSGDTGKAALEGYKDIDKIRIMVFYPVDGVSKVQKLQMSTQTGNNVNVMAIRGNFDDAQTGVKNIFCDEDVIQKLDAKGYYISSANSINWGRLAPQIAYYISAYCDLLNKKAIQYGDKINFCVPTGNFGNILAAYIAYRMGLPIGRLVCASNSNNVLTDFLETGVYDRNRTFHLTMSPSMDILISSNLERLLYFVAGQDKTSEWMSSLSSKGKYEIDEKYLNKIQELFVGYYADEKETSESIKENFEKNHYLCDTHTGVAFACAKKYLKDSDDRTPMVVVSTASPYKFASDVYYSLTNRRPEDPLEALEQLSSYSSTDISYPLKGIKDRTVRFKDVADPAQMADKIFEFIG